MIFKRRSAKEQKTTLSPESYREAINEALTTVLEYESLSLKYYGEQPEKTGDVEVDASAIIETIERLAEDAQARIDRVYLYTVQLTNSNPPYNGLKPFYDAVVQFLGSSTLFYQYTDSYFENSIIHADLQEIRELRDLISMSEKRLEYGKTSLIEEIRNLAEIEPNQLIEIGVLPSILLNLFLDDLAEDVEKLLVQG